MYISPIFSVLLLQVLALDQFLTAAICAFLYLYVFVFVYMLYVCVCVFECVCMCVRVMCVGFKQADGIREKCRYCR